MKLSIIMPNYNYGHYIAKAIESIFKQDFNNVELIIVDDGSSDNSCLIIKTFKEKYGEKLKFICQQNHGQSFALNVALKEVSGQIIGWLNSDDYYQPNVFGKIVDIFIKNKEIDAVFGDVIHVDKEDKIIKKKMYLDFNYNSAVFLGFGRSICSNTIFWKKEIGSDLYFNEKYTYSMDSEYWSRLLYNRKVVHIELFVANWRQHEEAKTFQRAEKNSTIYKRARKEYADVLKKSYFNTEISKSYSIKLFRIFRIYYFTRSFILKIIKGKYNS